LFDKKAIDPQPVFVRKRTQRCNRRLCLHAVYDITRKVVMSTHRVIAKVSNAWFDRVATRSGLQHSVGPSSTARVCTPVCRDEGGVQRLSNIRHGSVASTDKRAHKRKRPLLKSGLSL
jgi:hypothetical protein